jgi:hypothetical protein
VASYGLDSLRSKSGSGHLHPSGQLAPLCDEQRRCLPSEVFLGKPDDLEAHVAAINPDLNNYALPERAQRTRAFQLTSEWKPVIQAQQVGERTDPISMIRVIVWF